MKTVEKAPAKINLALDVLRKRADGYHEVKMVMTTIDLADRIECQNEHADQINILSSAPFVPEDKRNLAYQAANLIKKKYDIKSGVTISIDKHIPVAAGLAGGSSDAAATIRALNRLWNINMSKTEMLDVANQIGSDVAFCTVGGTALATGRGEILKPLPDPPHCWVILAKPSESVSTADVYRSLNLQETQHPDVDAAIRAINENDFSMLCRHLGNALEPVTIPKHPAVQQIKSQMQKAGAEGVLMSGSGPTVFGLTVHDSRMQRIVNSLKGFCDYVNAVRLYPAKHLD